MTSSQLRTAGAGGDETEAARRFGDGIYELLKLVTAIVDNSLPLEKAGGTADNDAVGQVLFDMCLCRATDLSLTYISSVLRLVYLKQPNALRSSEKVDVNFIFQFTSMDQLLLALLERKVRALSFQSLNDLDADFSKRLGMPLFANDSHRARAVQLVALRNLIVHNQGIVDEHFMRQYPDAPGLGTRIQVGDSENNEALLFLVDWIADLDVRMIEKFSLPTRPRIPRPKITILAQ
jgi:hypothetical protein